MPPEKRRFSESVSADYPHLSQHKLNESALSWVLQFANYVIRTARLEQRVTAAGQLDVV